MYKSIFVLLTAVLLLNSPLASAENRGIQIDMHSTGGGPVDFSALQAVRRIAGYGVASGVIDTFTVYAPKVGGPIPKEGGISACAEVGFASKKVDLTGFAKELRSVHPAKGTVYTVDAVANCANPNDQPTVCTMDVKSCPDGSFVSRVPPSCAFAACPEPVVCTEDAKICPDGSSVSRIPPSCKFADCPAPATTE